MSEPQEPKTHVVRLVMSLPGATPADAVRNFVAELATNGLTNWVYAVLDPETGVPIGEFNGYGDDVGDELYAIQERMRAEEPPAPATPSEQDAALALAEQLNAE